MSKRAFPSVEEFKAKPCVVYWWDAAGRARDCETDADLEDLARCYRATFGHLVKRDRTGVWVAGTLDHDGTREDVTFVTRAMIHSIVMLGAPEAKPKPAKRKAKPRPAPDLAAEQLDGARD
jgi:hypothetical protein